MLAARPLPWRGLLRAPGSGSPSPCRRGACGSRRRSTSGTRSGSSPPRQAITKSFGIFWVVPFLSDTASRSTASTSLDMNVLMRPFLTWASSLCLLSGRQRPNSGLRYEIATVASVSSASWIAASSAESPPPTTSTRLPAYWRGSISR